MNRVEGVAESTSKYYDVAFAWTQELTTSGSSLIPLMEATAQAPLTRGNDAKTALHNDRCDPPLRPLSETHKVEQPN